MTRRYDASCFQAEKLPDADVIEVIKRFFYWLPEFKLNPPQRLPGGPADLEFAIRPFLVRDKDLLKQPTAFNIQAILAFKVMDIFFEIIGERKFVKNVYHVSSIDDPFEHAVDFYCIETDTNGSFFNSSIQAMIKTE